MAMQVQECTIPVKSSRRGLAEGPSLDLGDAVLMAGHIEHSPSRPRRETWERAQLG
jgi:hypothetical protein